MQGHAAVGSRMHIYHIQHVARVFLFVVFKHFLGRGTGCHPLVRVPRLHFVSVLFPVIHVYEYLCHKILFCLVEATGQAIDGVLR